MFSPLWRCQAVWSLWSSHCRCKEGETGICRQDDQECWVSLCDISSRFPFKHSFFSVPFFNADLLLELSSEKVLCWLLAKRQCQQRKVWFSCHPFDQCLVHAHFDPQTWSSISTSDSLVWRTKDPKTPRGRNTLSLLATLSLWTRWVIDFFIRMSWRYVFFIF